MDDGDELDDPIANLRRAGLVLAQVLAEARVHNGAEQSQGGGGRAHGLLTRSALISSLVTEIDAVLLRASGDAARARCCAANSAAARTRSSAACATSSRKSR